MMAKTTINNGDSGLSVRTALNTMFSELYGAIVGHVTGRWYAPASVQVNTGSAQPANSISFLPFFVAETVTISDLGCRITTAVASGNLQLAIYASDATTKLPTGVVLASTASITTASAAAVSADITGPNVTLTPGLYWMAVNVDATAGAGNVAFVTMHGSAALPGATIGDSTLASILGNGTSTTVWTFAQTFNTWPDMTAQTLAIATFTRGALVAYKVA